MENQPTDGSLFNKIRNNDSEAFRMLFERYYQKLLAIAINIVHDLALAKDIVQEVFFQIWAKRHSLSQPKQPEAYLKRATINRAINKIKARKRITNLQAAPEKESSSSHPGNIIEASELDQLIQKTLAELPERCRLIFIMKRIEGQSLKEIAATLDISTKTAENQITKALKALKNALKSYNQDGQA